VAGTGTTRRTVVGRNHVAERRLVPIRSGARFRIVSPSSAGLVTPELAAKLHGVFARLAARTDHSGRCPLAIELRRGVVGHHKVGRATDVYGVGGRGLAEWKRLWDAGLRQGNLGWALYRELLEGGGWSRPAGYPVQLFGPWTREAGPWRRISDRLLRAHADHVHVAL